MSLADQSLSNTYPKIRFSASLKSNVSPIDKLPPITVPISSSKSSFLVGSNLITPLSGSNICPVGLLISLPVVKTDEASQL